MINNLFLFSKFTLSGLITLFLFSFSSIPLDAQIERTLRKEFGKSEGVRGIEKVFIETNLRDTIRNGIYEISTFQQITAESRLVQTKVQGQYRQDEKNGPWSYLYENFAMQVDSIVNRKPIVHLEGSIRSLKFSFTDGNPNNIWMAKLDSIRRDTLFKTNVNATMNWDSLSFAFVDKTVPRLKTVDGYMTREGFMNGTWKIEYDHEGLKFEESREYIQGFLVGYSVKELSSGILFEEELFSEVFTLIEQTLNDSTFTTPANYSIDTFSLADMNKFDLASSRQMNFEHSDEWIRTAHQLMFQPYIPGGKKVNIGDSDYFRTRMFKRNISTVQLDSLSRLQTVNLPALRSSIQSLLNDRVLQMNRSQSDSIALIFNRLELLDRQIEDMQYGLETMKSDSFQVASVRPVQNIHGFNTTLKQLNDEEEVLLYTFSSPTKPRKSNIHFVTSYVQEATALVEREQDKLAIIKQRIIDLEMLVDLEGRIKQEVDGIRAIYGNYTQSATVPENDILGYEGIRQLGTYMNAEFAHRQLDARLSQIEMTNEVSRREEVGLATLDYIKELQTQAERYDQMSATALSMDKLYSNQRGKRQFKHLYNKSEALWNIKLQNLMKDQDWQTFQSKLAETNTFLQAMESISKRDSKSTKAINKLVRRADDLQEVEQLILSAEATN